MSAWYLSMLTLVAFYAYDDMALLPVLQMGLAVATLVLCARVTALSSTVLNVYVKYMHCLLLANLAVPTLATWPVVLLQPTLGVSKLASPLCGPLSNPLGAALISGVRFCLSTSLPTAAAPTQLAYTLCRSMMAAAPGVLVAILATQQRHSAR